MILLTGGGTGGHLSIIKAIKEELNSRDILPVFIGSQSGQDKQWFERDKGWSKKFFLKTEGVVNKRGFNKFFSLLNIIFNSFKCSSIFKEYKIKKVFSVGGYSAASVSFAAVYSKKELYLHEQNAVAGRLNQILFPFSKRVFCSFIPPYDPYPVQKDFFELRKIRKEIKTILFLGGSQGALQINNFALSIAKKLKEREIKIVHQTGIKDFERVKKEYEKIGVDVEIFSFSTSLSKIFSKCDIAVSRAGASTIWELAANALPAFFIPYPYAYKNHQFFNAKFIADKKGGFLANKEIEKELFKILDKNDLSLNSFSLMELFKPDGAKKIVSEMLL